MNRSRVVMKINRYSTSSVLGRAYLVDNGMSAHTARYTDPNPSLPVLQAQIKVVEEAAQAAQTGGKGAFLVRNVERDNLTSMLETERSYVQTLCDKAPPGQAALIAHDAGMEIAVVASRVKPILEATGAAPGTVALEANATLLAGKKGKMRFFNWQWTNDGGQTFHDAPSTPHARTVIANFTPLAVVGFRVSVTDKSGPGPWSQVVTTRVP